jgi:two-component system, response regulator YesN
MAERLLKVVLADDEVPILEDLCAFPFEKHGLQVVGTARDGREALALCERFAPDILITDIVMPVLDGIDLSRRVRKILPGLQIIFVTLYRDFDYARQGIRLGVREYLLKGVYTEGDLAVALERASAEIRRVERGADRPSSSLADFVAGAAGGSGRSGRGQGIDLAGLIVFPAVPAVARLCYGAATGPDTRALVLEDASRALTADGTGACVLGDCELALYARAGQRVALHESLLKAVRSVERRHVEHKVSLQVAITDAVDDLLAYRKAAQQCRSAALSGFYAARGGVVDAASVRFRPMRPDERDDLTRLVRRHIAGRDELEAALRAGLVRQGDPDWIDPTDVRGLFADWLTDLGEGQQGGGPAQAELPSLSLRGLLDTLAAAATLAPPAVMTAGRREVDQVIAYIHENMGAAVRLEDAAGIVGLSPNYLGSLFRRQTGAGFKEYLNRARMEAAAFYMRTTNLRVYEIADRVGIRNYRYFSDLFHRHFGLTAQEYRAVGR